MKLIISDDQEMRMNDGMIHVSDREMKALVALLEKWGIDFEAIEHVNAADTPKARVVKSGMPKGYKFPLKKCPRCLAMVAENRYVQHIRSKCVLR